MCTFPRQIEFVWSWTICPPIRPARYTKPALRSAKGPAPIGVPLCPKARQLVEHGGDRNRRAARSSLDRRIATPERLVSEIAAWKRQRNATRAQVKWMFTTEKARAKMGRAYPEPASIKAHSTKES
jgi:hypothetical protein